MNFVCLPPSIVHVADHVFDTEVTTKSVFDSVAKNLVRSVLHGYNGTIFAYGQTASGKTHTMQGSSRLGAFNMGEPICLLLNPRSHAKRPLFPAGSPAGSRDNPGIIPLAVQEIMDTIADTPQRAFLIRCSYLEIYNECITDLLTDKAESEKLEIRESKARVGAV